MNWLYLIPLLCGGVMLFVDPVTLMVMVIGLPFIFVGAFILEKVFGPRTKKG